MRQYVSEVALDFSGDATTRFALEMHHVSEGTAAAMGADGRPVVELTFDDGRLAEARLAGDLTHVHRDTIEEFADLPHRSSLTPLAGAPVVPLMLEDDPDGTSRIGGPPPDRLVMPNADFTSGYHFIGEMDLAHIGGAGVVPLIYPLFLDYHPPVFLDVSDLLRPKVFPVSEGRIVNLAKPDRPFTTDAIPYGPRQEDGDVTEIFRDGGSVIFQEFRGTFRPADLSIPGGQITAGIPDWIQNPELPLCPKTGAPMRFLAQIGGGRPAVARDIDVGGWDLDYRFEEMTFWTDGVLFAFANPEAGTLCLHPQAT